jgi:hypothetical protein
MIVVLGLAILAGCGEGEGMLIGSALGSGSSESSDKDSLTVTNQGTVPVYGVAEDWYGSQKHDFTLDPGDTATFEFTGIVYRMKLHIWRSTDSLLLIDDFWETAALAQPRTHVTVTVNP